MRNAIRSRGLGSRAGLPGLRVDFDRYGRPDAVGLTSVVLCNNTQDPSSLHERVAMRPARMLPASRTAHARLFVNGSLSACISSLSRWTNGSRQFNENDTLKE